MDDTRYLLDPLGGVTEVPAAEADSKLSSGFRDATPQQISDYQAGKAYREKYGGLKGKMMAADFAAMRALTFGASDKIGAAVNPNFAEDAKGFKEVNPEWDTAGTIGGLGLGLAAPSAPMAIAKSGSAIRTAIGGGSESILRKALASGVGSAVEGAAYGAGQSVSEQALGDPDLTAQSVLAHMGRSAGFAGAIGATGSLAYNIARDILPENVRDRVKEFFSNYAGKKTVEAAGGKQAVDELGAQEASRLGRAARDMGISGASSPENYAAKATEAAQGFDGDLSKMAKEVDTRLPEDAHVAISDLTKAAPKNFQQTPEFSQLLGKLETEYAGPPLGMEELHSLWRDLKNDQFAAGPGPLSDMIKSFRGNINDAIEDVLGSVKGGSEYRSLWRDLAPKWEDAKTIADLAGEHTAAAGSDLGAMAGGLGAGLGASAASAAMGAVVPGLGHVVGHGLGGMGLGKLAGMVSRSPGLQAGLADAAAGLTESLPGALPQAARAALDTGVAYGSAATDRALQNAGQDGSLRRLVDETGKRVQGERQVSEFKPGMDRPTEGSLVNVAQNPEQVAALAELERIQHTTLGRIDQEASRLVRADGAGDSLSSLSPDHAKTPEQAVRMYQKRIEAIRRVMDDPAAMARVLGDQTDIWFDHAPQTAQALQVGTVRALNFLNGKIPQQDAPGPLMPPMGPTRDQVSRFNRYWEAVEDPTSILKMAKHKTLTDDHIEAVRSVYPQLYQRMQQAVVEGVTKMNKPVPYQNRLMVGKILDMPVDGSTAGAPLVANQQIYSGLSQPSPTPGGGSPGSKKFTLGKRSEPSTTAAALRGQEE